MSFLSRLKFWDGLDDDSRKALVRIIGVLTGIIAVFTFLSIFSYILHWQDDMGLVGDLSGNAGMLGYKTGKLLVCRCFGLGSIAIAFALAAISLRLLAGKFHDTLPKTIVLALFGAFIFSLALTFIGKLCALPTALGCGLGGRCGDFVCNWGIRTVGELTAGLLIGFFIIVWLFCCSRKFTKWFAGNPERDEEKARARREARAERKRLREERKNAKKAAKSGALKAEIEKAAAEEAVAATVAAAGPETAAEVAEPQDIEGLTDAPEAAAAPISEDLFPAEAIALTEEASGPSLEVIRDEDGLNAEIEEELPPIDNRLDPAYGLPKFKFPSLDLLQSYSEGRKEVSMDELNRNNNKIRTALANYRIEVVDVKAVVGPTITLYKVYPAPGVQISQIKRLQEDIAMSLNAKGVRVVTLNDSVGIEVANDHSSIVPVKALLNDESYRTTKADLPITLGYTITQKVKIFDLADAPHLLIAGATKQGKSVCLNEIVTSLLYAKHPSELKFVFIDPKMVEFSAYARLLKHYLAVLPDAGDEDEEKKNAIVKNPKNAERILRSLTLEMDERYQLLSEAGVNNLKLYNSKFKDRKLRPDHGHRFLPYIVVIVDEYADLTMSAGAGAETKASAKSITNSIIRLAQKGRAAGIHVILATQRPSVDVISGQIKANFPARIAFRVAQRVDSMTILDSPGADKLIGKGDMLFSAGIDAERIQCGLVEGDEIDAITEFIGKQKGPMKSYNTPYYLPSVDDQTAEGAEGGVDMSKVDERFEEAARMVVMLQKGSTSALQTKLGMGFAKAARVMDQLESAGIVGPSLSGGKPREVLVSDLDQLETILNLYR